MSEQQYLCVDQNNAESKNAILKGVNFDEAATGRERNTQIGGHRGGKNDY